LQSTDQAKRCPLMANWPYNTVAWRKLRHSKRGSEPLCYPCKARGVTTPANTVDHIKSIASGVPFPPLSGLMSMCARRHNEKTSANDRTHSKPVARQIKGCDADGNPVDLGDDWHGARAANHQNRSAHGPMLMSAKYLVSGESQTKSDDDFEPGFA